MSGGLSSGRANPHNLTAPVDPGSGVGPSFSATDEIASHREPQCRWVKDHPHRTLTELIGVLPPTSLLCHGSILSRVGACAIPGEAQPGHRASDV